MEKLDQLDTKLFLFFNNLGAEPWDPFWLWITEKYSSMPVYILMAILLLYKFRWKKTLLILLLAAILITLSDQTSNLSKDFFQKLRPCQEDFIEKGRFIAKRCGEFGFFSAHASTSVGIALFLSLIFKPVFKYIIPFLLFWAFLLSYSRIYIGVHDPSDIIVGWLMGALFAWMGFKTYQYLTERHPGFFQKKEGIRNRESL